jgi:ketosteroid isomerase-like protein
MPRSKLPPGTPDDTEAAFYEALQQADIDRLMACWADEDDIVCVHPGGPRLVGMGAVRGAFEALFANGAVQVQPERVRRLETAHCSVHSVIERVAVLGDDGIQVAWVTSTNVYLKTAQGWRMVAHHASPGSRHEPAEAGIASVLLH